MTGIWELLSGKASYVSADYSIPHPGQITRYGMVLDNANRYIYLFGGGGYDNYTTLGTMICIDLIE